MKQKKTFQIMSKFMLLLFIFIASINIINAALCDNIASIYHFDGDALDSSGNGNNGIVNGATQTSGKSGFGNAYHFNANQNISVLSSTSLSPSSSFSVSFWVKGDTAPSTTVQEGIISKGASYIFNWGHTGAAWRQSFSVWSQNYASNCKAYISMPLSSNTWYNIVGVFDDSADRLKIYLNGASQDDVSCTINPWVTSDNLTINGLVNPFVGAVDDVVIWKRALSASEISGLYNANQAFSCQIPIIVQPNPVVIHTVSIAHSTTRPHNRKLVYDNITGNYFAFFGAGTESDGVPRNRWKSSSDGVNWTAGGTAYEGGGYSSGNDVLLDGTKIIYLHSPNALAKNSYRVKTFDIVGNNLVYGGINVSLANWSAGDNVSITMYGSITKDTNGYYWVSATQGGDGMPRRILAFRSNNPNDVSSWSAGVNITGWKNDMEIASDIIALDNGKVLVYIKDDRAFNTWPFDPVTTPTAEIKIALYDPLSGGWQPTYQLVGPSGVANKMRSTAEFEPQAQKVHLVYADPSGNLIYRNLSSPYRQGNWSAGVAIASGLRNGFDEENDISLEIDLSTSPAKLYTIYVKNNRYYGINSYDGYIWRGEESFGNQVGANEGTMIKEYNGKIAALYSATNTINSSRRDVIFQEYITQLPAPSNCTDNDHDGYGTNCAPGTDCDDNNINVHALIACNYNGVSCGNYNLCAVSCPAPPSEICGNGIDENCDGVDLACQTNCTDNDHDGYNLSQTGCGNVFDCNDSDANINPSKTEVCGNGIDENCDGMSDDTCPSNTTGIIFEDDFDSQADWTIAQPPYNTYAPICTPYITCNPLAPQGWNIYRTTSVESCSEIGKNTLNINSVMPHSGTKGVQYWNEPCVSVGGSWGSDGLLGASLGTGYNEIYVRWYMKFPANWQMTTDPNQDSPRQKYLHIWGYGAPPNIFGFNNRVGQLVPWSVIPTIQRYNHGADPITWSISTYPQCPTGDRRATTGDNSLNNGGCTGTEWYVNDVANNINYYFPKSGGGNCFTGKETGCPFDGNWHSYQFRIKLSSAAGAANGEEQFYYDNNSIGLKTNLVYAVSAVQEPIQNISYFAIGGNNDNFYSPAIEQNHFIDDVIVSTGFINDSYIIGNQTQNQTCTDSDHDSYNLSQTNCGVADCNDSNASINPSATEFCGNSIDENCDGLDLQCNKADIDKNSCVDSNELTAFVQRWFKSSADVSIRELVSAIKEWKKGC